MRRKFGMLLMIAGMAVLAGCAGNKESGAKPTVTQAIQQPDPTEEIKPTAEPTKAPTAVPTAEPTRALVKREPIASGEMRNLSPKETVAKMCVGWNLGNTMDATGSGMASETSWGSPKTTKEMIQAVSEAGFDTLRIPCTWYNHMSGEDNVIDPAWLARVKEIVDYGFENGMYVILNAHHENVWQRPEYASLDAVKKKQTDLWRQVAEYFKDYGDCLIFEGMNEPRIEGGENEWNGGTAEGRDCINRLNQNFIDAVRATGGNNETRLLLITTHSAAVTEDAFNGFVFPEDEHIALSLHAYTPYKFTYDDPNESQNTAEYGSAIQMEIGDLMKKVKQYAKDVPVILTECGAVVKTLYGKPNTKEVGKWQKGYFKTAKKNGIPCIIWDNGIYDGNGERFGLLNRKSLTWYYEEILDAVAAVIAE